MPRLILALTLGLGLASSAPTHAQDKTKQSLDKLLQTIKNSKPEERTDAIAQIAKLDANLAVPALVGLFRMNDEDVRLHATLALGGLGKPAIGALEKALADPHETVRFYAVWALGLAGTAAQPATAALIRALGDEDEDVRYKAAFALGRVALESDEAIAALIAALKDTERDVIEEASAALAKLGRRAIAPLRKALTQRDVAYFAADALGRMAKSEDDEIAKAALVAVPDVVRAFDGTRAGDEQTLMALMPALGTKALPSLRDALKDKDWLIRYRLVQALGQIGVEAEQQADTGSVKQVVEMLLDRVADSDFRVRTIACNNLAQITLYADLMEPVLDKACLDETFAVSLAAYGALSVRNTPGAQDRLNKRIAAAKADERLRLACLLPGPHEDLLLKNLDHADAGLRLRNACGLAAGTDGQPLPGKIGGQLAPVLAEALKSPQLGRRRDAIYGLMKIAPQTDAVVLPPLLLALKDDDSTVRSLAAIALFQSPLRDAKLVIPALSPLLQDADYTVRQSAVNALKQYGIGATPFLIGMLKARNYDDRLLACQTLKELGGQRTREAVPTLMELAKAPENRPMVIATLQWLDVDKSFGLMLDILRADKAVGPTLRRAAKDSSEPAKVLAVLVRELKDSDPRVAQEAAQALEQLETILPRLRYRVLFEKDVLDALDELPKLAKKRLTAGEPQTRRAIVGQLTAVRSVAILMQQRLGGLEIQPADINNLYTRLAALSQQIEELLQASQLDDDREVRRLARRALHTQPTVNDPFSMPPGVFPVP
jgi:HEAT repeat protein